jgi:hypothetical protein
MNEPPKPTGKKRGKRADLDAWIDRERPAVIGEAEFGRILADLAPISESYLRKLLRESGASLAPIIAGVRQSTLDELEASLNALLADYLTADAPRRKAIRDIVITAKDHARWAAKSHPGEKDEMILWMTTWLENPPVFPQWARLRREKSATMSE